MNPELPPKYVTAKAWPLSVWLDYWAYQHQKQLELERAMDWWDYEPVRKR